MNSAPLTSTIIRSDRNHNVTFDVLTEIIYVLIRLFQ